MIADITDTIWEVVGKTIQGYTHKKQNLPRQDAIAWQLMNLDKSYATLVISDGHGSQKCFRSDKGSSIATLIGLNISRSLINMELQGSSLREIEFWFKYKMPKELVKDWTDAVLFDFSKNPFTEEELRTLNNEKSISEVSETPLVAYGATILLAIISNSYLVLAQLGDGDILTIDSDNLVMRPLPTDNQLFGNSTTSLCSENAWEQFRTKVMTIHDDKLRMVLMSSDGYSNSFTDDEGFLSVGSDILKLIEEKGLEFVRENIENWITVVSRKGSGDDISLGIIYKTRSKEIEKDRSRVS